MTKATPKSAKSAAYAAKVQAKIDAVPAEPKRTRKPKSAPAAELDASKFLPSKEQTDVEFAAAQAEEQANLAREAEEMAQEQQATTQGGYCGPMLALRQRVRAHKYVKAPNGQPMCGDDLAVALGGLEPKYVIAACIAALDLTRNPYEHLNIGQQSMNLRNKLRGALKRGEFGMGVVNEAIEDATIMQERDIEAEEARIQARRMASKSAV